MNNPIMNKFLIFILLLIGAFFLLRISFVLLGLIMPFILGFLLAALANPLKKKLEQMGLPPAMASFFSLFFIFVLAGLLIYLLFALARSGVSFAGDYTSKMLGSFTQSLRNTYSTLQNQYPSLLPQDFDAFVESLKGGGILTLRQFDFSTRIFAMAKGLPSMLIFLLFTLMSSFYFSMGYEQILRFLKDKVMVFSWVEGLLQSFRSSAKLGLRSWFKAQLYIMSVTSLTSTIFFLLIKVSYALPLGIALAIFDALPIFGAGAILWPISAYFLLTQAYSKAILSLFVYVVIVSTRQIIEPRLIGKQIGIHPLVTLLTIYVGYKLLGVAGIILGVIGLAIATSVINSRALSQEQGEPSL